MEMYEYLESDDDNGRLQWRQVVVTGIESGVGTSMFLVYYLLRFVSHSAYLLVTGLHACCSAHIGNEYPYTMICLAWVQPAESA